MISNNYFKIIGKKRLRNIMRGYRKLNEQNSLVKISIILSEISDTKLNIISSKFSKIIYGEGINFAEIILRQYLVHNLAGTNLNEALLISVGCNKKVIYPLPKIWQKIILKNGFNVNKFYSTLLWKKYILNKFLNGCYTLSKNILGFLFIKKHVPKNLSNSIFFTSITKSNIPKDQSQINNYNLIIWFIRNKHILNIDFNTIHHLVPNSANLEIDGISISNYNRLIPGIRNWLGFLKLLKWAFFLILNICIYFFRGFWWNCILINESISAKRVQLSNSNDIALSYIFSNSEWIYRPLWTYEAEKKGAQIILYFYSTNCEPFKTKQGYLTQYRGYASMNWPKYLVWDLHQENFIKRAVDNNPKIEIVGPIWYQDSNIEINLPNNRQAVAVFDVQPVRNSFYQKLALYPEYYTPSNAIAFLKDISLSIESHGLTMIWKRKRNIGKLIHPQFKYFIEKLKANKNILIVDPDIAAIRVIEKSIAVISMPFTSTALIAKNMGRPSVYYDPFGVILKDDRGSHDIKIITDINELNEWISSLIL